MDLVLALVLVLVLFLSPVELDELLAQATCAVRDGSATDGGGDVKGTAWLVKDTGHLLTAGHVVQSISTEGVWVRFPDTDRDVWASCVVPPENNKGLAIDFAVLSLVENTRRQPLPFILASNVEGRVRARGYGSNLPNAQHGGTGTLLGHYKRDNDSAKYLFQYESATLAVEGFSGAAIHSESAHAVVGLQVEQERGRTALAMPLARITEHWADLLAAALKPRRGLCVLLLPVRRSEQSRDQLVNEVIWPVLDSLNLELYVSELGRSTTKDLERLERADVVIADVSRADANVVYELTIAHGIGTPDVVFAEPGTRSAVEEMPFQVMELDLRDLPRARGALEQRLVAVRAIFEALGESDSHNAITDFFSVPLTQVSAANALALGYEVNFVRPVGSALLEAQAGLDCTITIDGRALSAEEVKRVRLTVVMPARLSWANDDFIHQQLQEPGLVLPAVVEHPTLSRPRSMKALPVAQDRDELIHLVDAFPTTMTTMIEAIDQRLGFSSEQRVLPVWKAIEGKEIDRFHSRLVQRINADQTGFRGRRLRDICRVTSSTTTFPTLRDPSS